MADGRRFARCYRKFVPSVEILYPLWFCFNLLRSVLTLSFVPPSVTFPRVWHGRHVTLHLHRGENSRTYGPLRLLRIDNWRDARERACRAERTRVEPSRPQHTLHNASNCVRLWATRHARCAPFRLFDTGSEPAFPSPASNFPANSRPRLLADRASIIITGNTELLRAIVENNVGNDASGHFLVAGFPLSSPRKRTTDAG